MRKATRKNKSISIQYTCRFERYDLNQFENYFSFKIFGVHWFKFLVYSEIRISKPTFRGLRFKKKPRLGLVYSEKDYIEMLKKMGFQIEPKKGIDSGVFLRNGFCCVIVEEKVVRIFHSEYQHNAQKFLVEHLTLDYLKDHINYTSKREI